MTCNREYATLIDRNAVYDHYKIYLSDDIVTDLTAISAAGGVVTGAVYSTLVYYGYIASLATPVTAGLSACLAVELAWLDVANNGCGVVVDMYLVENYSSPGDYMGDIPVHYISSQ